MFRSVLLCYDGTREARDALQTGAELVASLNAAAHVLVVGELTNTAWTLGHVTEATVELATDDCTRILSEGSTWLQARGIIAQHHIALGHPIDVIPRVAAQLKVDLVVVGHTQRRRWGRWWAGSENLALSDRLDCSLLIAMAAQRSSSVPG